MTTAFRGTVGCASYAALRNASHYGSNDFVAPSSTHQVHNLMLAGLVLVVSAVPVKRTCMPCYPQRQPAHTAVAHER